ncbi:hypothetical protein E1181_00600 [Saccharopolyspora terrae]|uniref:Uncharacterized protein n=1 Tax=Saccharopolyspora terrae TaxID=2530384 RepID=A0A4V2YC91_9PSEU|nr:hypothetical protein [Saccharopolyspora terrae]TDD10566.1 hypothetical protein E1181_00600 [Saccharopolyspora terrae]
MHTLSFDSDASAQAAFSGDADFHAEAMARSYTTAEVEADQSSQAQLIGAAASTFEAEGGADAEFDATAASYGSADFDMVDTYWGDSVEGDVATSAASSVDYTSSLDGGFGDAMFAGSGEAAAESSAATEADFFLA